VFGREQLRELIKAYAAQSPLSGIRCELGPEQPWQSIEFRSPAPRVSWVARPAPGADTTARAANEPSAARSARGASAKAPSSRRKPDDDTGAPPAVTPAAATSPLSPPGPSESAAQATQDIASLIESRALQRSSETDDEAAWLESTGQKLRTALLGY